MLILVGLATIVLLTAVTGYFVAQEFAYVAADRGRLQRLAEQGDQAAQRALRVTSRLSFTLSGAQLGITVTALLVGYVSEPLLGEGLAAVLGLTGLSHTASLSISIVVALVLSTVVQMVLGELAPKNLAIARTEALAKALSRSTLAYLAVAGPLIRLFDVTSNRLLRAVGIEPVQELPHGATPEDLHRIIDESRDGGHLDAELSALLDRGLEFRTLSAEQAMTPRVDVHTIGAEDPAVRVVELADTGHSRFPVVGESVDDIVGVVGIPDVLTVAPAERSIVPVRLIAAPPLLIPASLPLPAVLERLRAEHRQLACVVDEYGGFAGVLTFEDIAEEVVGPILDEDDLPEATVHTRPDGSWLVPARWRMDEIEQATGIALPEGEDYDTIGGLVMHRLGRTPQPGDQVVVPEVTAPAVDDPAPARGVRVEVVSVKRRVPDTVAIGILDEAQATR
ncbi:MAG TPA: hemolysin family protein [Actinophytocola sp.]|uniref:hemolysin family protein n=1 Tax=Actinophytocola sp. TaxID=1872138 RepID=UPI002DB6A5B4|nr:hemolysin family protein [Actinophytocola sp.]HEU5474906.1 hemolysin family protein [Actinophytocola sp.]